MKTESLQTLPALRSLGNLADHKPTVIIDTREQAALPIRRLPVALGTLQSGDYSLAGSEDSFAIERKSVADLVACVVGANRERFSKELHRLNGFRFKRLLVVGARAEVEQHRYRSGVSPKAVLSTLAAFEIRFNIPVVWSPTPETAAALVEGWCWWQAREILQSANALLAGISAAEPQIESKPQNNSDEIQTHEA